MRIHLISRLILLLEARESFQYRSNHNNNPTQKWVKFRRTTNIQAHFTIKIKTTN